MPDNTTQQINPSLTPKRVQSNLENRELTASQAMCQLNEVFTHSLEQVNKWLIDPAAIHEALAVHRRLIEAYQASLRFVEAVAGGTLPSTVSVAQSAAHEIEGIIKRELAYSKVVIAATHNRNFIAQDANNQIYQITGPLFHEVLEAFPPHQLQQDAKISLADVYRAFYHPATGVLGVANRGVYLYTKSPKREINYVTAHDRFMLYRPNHGIEIVNVGIVGNITQGKPIVRAESACCPSFQFGSQRCNCHDQWMAVKEEAAQHNSIELPDNLTPRKLEEFLANHYRRNDSWAPIPTRKDGPGFIMIHMDSQNGMGCGASEGVYTPNLFDVATMRHGGLYTAEQGWMASLKGGYEATGLPSLKDLRSLNNGAAFQVPGIILLAYGIKGPIVALTNNEGKLKAFADLGIPYDRVLHLGRVDLANLEATNDRKNEYQHRIPGGEKDVHMTTFFEDLARLNADLVRIGAVPAA